MDRNYKLYKHTSPSGKVYIGITKQEPKKRWKNGKGYKDNNYFTNAINKYGWDNFTHEVLFNNLTKEEAELMEKMYITLYDTTNRDNGYNNLEGGNAFNGLRGELNPMYGQSGELSPIKGRKHTKEELEKMKNNHVDFNGKNNPCYGRTGELHPLYGKTGKDSARHVSVICITTKRIFFTRIEAGKYYNIKTYNHISSCCNGKRKSCGKLPDGTPLVWRYLNYKHNKTYKVINNKEVA